MIKIRDAVSSDAPFLCMAEKAIALKAGCLVSRPNELKESSFCKKIIRLRELPNGKYIVAETEHGIVGHALLEPMSLEAIQHVNRLTIVVHMGFERQGHGMSMLTHLIEWARNAPLVEKIELNVRSINLPAIRLYQKCGFIFEGRFRSRIKDLDGQYIDDFSMGLFVKSRIEAPTAVSKAIGSVVSTRKDPIDDNWDRVDSCVRLDESQFAADALAGLEEFTHVEVVFQMNQVDISKVETSARHPRNNSSWPKVGIFAQRGKNRPNQLGTTVCRIVKVDGVNLYLEGLDAIDGTPVLDLKPWVQEFGPRGEVRQPSWMTELMQGYWKKH